MKIAVIVSTYNGEKYLEEQLESIVKQDDVNVDIYIRDDGSTDRTINILKKYSEQYENIFVEFGNNIGFRRSFIKKLINLPKKYDLYAFSDQDDFWECNKLCQATKLIEKYAFNTEPILYYSNLKICDEKLEVKKITKLDRRNKSIESNLLRRSIAGCTMVFNYKLYELLLNRNITDNMIVRGHDSFLITLCYSIDGKVICDSNAYIRYRKHSNNTSISTNTFLGRLKKEYEMIINKKGLESKIADAIMKEWYDFISVNNRNTLETIKECHKFKNRIKIFFSFRYRTGNIILTVVGKIKAICGLL